MSWEPWRLGAAFNSPHGSGRRPDPRPHYAAAKRDFATRAGLVPEEKQFTTEQLIEIYRCCADAIQRDYGLTYEQEQRIEEVQSQITQLLPDYVERLKAALEQDASQQPTM